MDSMQAADRLCQAAQALSRSIFDVLQLRESIRTADIMGRHTALRNAIKNYKDVRRRIVNEQ